ncbi:hypothetical protein H6P81_011756 [Aristolochia fimbriata]|uniref:Uncharacterized protein n=1 Tax=Aristolochia fimbriata TaxID=158543 RepID=A0AAV7EA11_ARIFI|nr:hypothetical protein H6P81_011756 [Aristolochia fimbriata]
MLLCRKHGTQGRINALVNYAGLRDIVHSPLNLTEEDWNEVLRTNLTRSLLVANSSRKQNLQNNSATQEYVDSFGQRLSCSQRREHILFARLPVHPTVLDKCTQISRHLKLHG